MRKIVIMPGGFHPFHAGHAALYKSAVEAFNDADVYVAATNDTKTRPFPFSIKEKLAKLAGVADKHFVQVKSPFKAEEITSHYNPNEDVLIFVRSEKDKNEQPKPGGTKKDGSPSYFQPYTGKDVQPFGKHAYMAYLPTVEFGPGITSATEIRNAWPKLDDRRKTAMVMSLYPVTQKNPKLAANVVKMLDMGMGTELDESWKNAIAGGAIALSALGAGAQTMPNVNAQQVELANKYYNVLVQRAKEDGRELDRRTLNFLKAKAENAAAVKIQQSSTQSQSQSQPQQGFPTQGSERKVSKDINNFESKKLNEFAPNDGGGDEKSYLLQLADDLADAMYGPNKNKQEVKNVSGKILAAGGNVKITWNDDSTFNVIMYHPTYFKQGHLIRLVGRGDELTEFAPPSSDRGNGGGGDDRSRRIRKLLEIAIQVAKEKNVDELGMIHAMNMIAGDEFFSVAVEGILPDITDKEYMFVLQSAYKTVKQGLAEGWFDNVKNKIKDSISDEKIIPMNINDLLIKVKNNDLNDMSGDSMAVNNIVRWAERTQNSEIIELTDSVKMYLDTFDNAPQWASWTGKKNTDINKLRELVSLLTQLKLKATEYFSKNQGLAEGSLQEVDRRGFLKGMGAAAGMAATGAQAAPFSHGEYKDQMTGKSQGRYSKVKADNGNATLTLRWPGSDQPRIDIDLPGKIINFGASGAAGARVKVGNGPVIETYLNRGQSGNYSWGAILDTNLVRKILTHSGELKIEVNIFQTGPEIFKFTIEQDNITKSIPAPNKKEVKKDETGSADSVEPSAEPSSSYAGRIKARIQPNITFSGTGSGPVDVEIRVTPDGTILARKIIKSSGDAKWDDAIIRAIDKTMTLPRDIDGRMPPTVSLTLGESVNQGVAEGDVVPFKQPPKTLTWKQVPKDVLLLANDWLWAEYDNTGLDAVMDPKGFGNGTANELQYITAKLQQKGWTIDHNDENDGPDEYNLILTNKRGQTVLLSIEDAQTFSGWAKGTSSYPSLNEGPIVKRIVHPNKINIYVKQGNKKSPLLVATDIPYKIFDKYVNKAIQKYPQFKQTDFSFKSSDKINEFVTPGGGDDREPDEEIVRKLAAMWWNGSIQQMKKAQQTLEAMGWDIGLDQSGDDDAGVFVIRIGDIHGDSYIAFPHSELGLNEDYLDEN